MNNADIRQAAKSAGVYLWQVAAALGISEPTMTRKLRFELSEDEKGKLKEIISSLAAQKSN